MSTDVTVALIAVLGTVLGSGGGVLISSKLTNYRIKQLEEKVNKHNSVIERTYVLEEKIKVVNHRVGNCEDELKRR